MAVGSTSAVKINERKLAAIKAIYLVGVKRAMKGEEWGLCQRLCRAVGWALILKVKERKVVGEGLYVALPVVGGQ